MNRVLFAGTVNAKPDIVYTPKGEKVVVFPMLVKEGFFVIDVIFVDSTGGTDFTGLAGKGIIVTGALTKTRAGSGNVFQLKANKILRTEE